MGTFDVLAGVSLVIVSIAVLMVSGGFTYWLTKGRVNKPGGWQ